MFGYGYCTIQLSVYRVIWLWVLFLSVVYIMIPFCSLVPFVCGYVPFGCGYDTNKFCV